MKVNSLQLIVLATEGSEVTASRESRPRAMMPAETYSSILHTSSSTHTGPSFTWTSHNKKGGVLVVSDAMCCTDNQCVCVCRPLSPVLRR